MENPLFMRRADEIAVLKKLIPISREVIDRTQELALNFSVESWKDFFARLWQDQVKRLSEIEWKIRELGGDPEKAASNGAPHRDPAKEPTDAHMRDKLMVLRAVNQLTLVLHVYAEVRKNPLSFDVKMLLRRHQ